MSKINIFKSSIVLTVLISMILNINVAEAKSTQNIKSPVGMVLIPEGYFVMGSPYHVDPPLPYELPKKFSDWFSPSYWFGELFKNFTYSDKFFETQHKVWIDAFYMDKYLVTFKEYDKFCEMTGRVKPDDHGWGRDNRPVINISWDDANAYAQWAGKRLPTEAEYEKAMRAGTNTMYFFGDDPIQLNKYAWYGHNAGNMTHPVGEKKPNPYGLYDIIGNVWEYCSDLWDSEYYDKSPERNPQGPVSMENVEPFKNQIVHVLRGGDYIAANYELRSAERNYTYGHAFEEENSFRCVKTK